ncbi:MAG: hypothetical protein Q7T55_19905 [Solirubrobacteraceae bacterium]|nr:hypothetical protein [Solirubrobacteraceae bacterium]
MGPVEPTAQIQRRRKRIPATEVRERMFEAAREIVRLRGVTISLEELSMDEVVSSAGVPRSSAYRLWPYKGDFVNDLLLHFAGPKPDWMAFSAFDEETLMLAAEILLKRWGDLSTTEGRLRAADEAIRVAVQRNFDAIAESPDWQVYAALSATARGNSNDASRSELVKALDDADLIFVHQMAAFYELVGRSVGLRPVEGMTYEQLALAGAAVVEGLAIRKVLLDASGGPEGPMAAHLLATVPAPRGSRPAPWSLVARAYRGIFFELLEPVAEWQADEHVRVAIERVAKHGPNGSNKMKSQT